MADKNIQRVVVTGHNRESAGCVTHYVRRIADASSGSVELHAGALITDEAGIIEDGTEYDLEITATKVRKKS